MNSVAVEPTVKGWKCGFMTRSFALYLGKLLPSVKGLHSERGDEILSSACCTDHLSLSGLLWSMVKHLAFLYGLFLFVFFFCLIGFDSLLFLIFLNQSNPPNSKRTVTTCSLITTSPLSLSVLLLKRDTKRIVQQTRTVWIKKWLLADRWGINVILGI